LKTDGEIIYIIISHVCVRARANGGVVVWHPSKYYKIVWHSSNLPFFYFFFASKGNPLDCNATDHALNVKRDDGNDRHSRGRNGADQQVFSRNLALAGAGPAELEYLLLRLVAYSTMPFSSTHHLRGRERE
jgi:hypothetical protein